jgi:hypothetical protein
MKSNASIFAATLLEKYGLEGAKEAALNEIMKAQRGRDFYLLSVWREAKRILEDEHGDFKTPLNSSAPKTSK